MIQNVTFAHIDEHELHLTGTLDGVPVELKVTSPRSIVSYACGRRGEVNVHLHARTTDPVQGVALWERVQALVRDSFQEVYDLADVWLTNKACMLDWIRRQAPVQDEV